MRPQTGVETMGLSGQQVMTQFLILLLGFFFLLDGEG
jgi:hypothetical protein